MRLGRACSLVVVAVAWLSGCAGGDGNGPKTTTGTVSANITDAPFPIESVASVNVFIVSIETIGRDATDAEVANPGSAGWTEIAHPNRNFDLMTLRNGVSASLGQSDLRTGTYRQFRLILDTNQSNVKLKDGTILSRTSTPGIQWPSAGMSGVKVNSSPLSVTPDGATILVDFNLENSFTVVGSSIQSGGLIFVPVIAAQRTK